MGNGFLKIIIAILAFIFIVSIPMTYASWNYCTTDQIVGEQTDLRINYFPWVGEEILPDDDDENITSQADGVQVVLDALNNVGLPSGQSSKLNQYIAKRLKNFNKFEYGSVDVKQDPESLFSDITTVSLNFEFILSGSIVNKEIQDFYLYMVDADVYNIAMEKWENSNYSASDYEDDPSIFQEYFYPVYRVHIEKNMYGEWAATEAIVGYAGYGHYEGSNNGAGQKAWTFDPQSWKEGSI